MTRVVVVGGGVLGTMHAREAIRRGHSVLQIDSDVEPRKASVRNFGLVWVSGRAAGAEVDLALRSRELWEQVAADAPGVKFRAHGSLTLALSAVEAKVMEEVGLMADAAVRQMTFVEPEEIRRINPAVRGDVLGGLWCQRDAIVEPACVLPAVRAFMESTGRYDFLPRRTVIDVDTGEVIDHTGDRHEGDAIIVCPGASYDLPVGLLPADAPVGRCRLQMMETEPHPERLTTSLADGDSLRYYPAYQNASLDLLPPQPTVAASQRMQLLVVQRPDGGLTIGDTHAYDEPFDVGVGEAAYDHLRSQAQLLLGVRLSRTIRRWSGVYSQPLDGAICYRSSPLPGVVVVTGAGGRGMTLSPALAEQTWDSL
jgi:FAD dependent oxidoreductase TIGR03364